MSKLKLYKPTTPARRKTSVIDYKSILTSDKPYKKLLTRVSSKAGRNNTGKITIRHRGGGERKMYRLVDFKNNFSKGFKVLSVEYDPNRTSFICLVADLKTGDKKYILHSKGMVKGQSYLPELGLVPGQRLLLKNVPLGSEVSQVEINPKQGARLVRSAGNYAIVTAKADDYITLKLPSGELRKFLAECECVFGRIGNESHELVRIGKAGRTRHKGFRPTVRGKAMNPVDHPHGGGEARNSIGLKSPKTPWGKKALGVKTRSKKNPTSRLIVKRRNSK